ncbi:MAG: metalloregulator ArsR/SmtB family transcription factor [Candidatus Limnocylindrales bacterium]
MAGTVSTQRTRTRAGAIVAAPRPIVRDFTGAAARADLTFEARTAFDFLVSMNVVAGEETDLLPEDATWLKDARAGLAPDVRNDIDSCFGGTSAAAFQALPGLAVNRPETADAASFVAVLDALSDDQLARLLLADLLRYVGSETAIDAVMSGDDAALADVGSRFDDHKAEVVGFLREPVPAVRQVRAIVAAWLPVYQQVEPRVAMMLERDVAGRRSDRQDLDQATLIERTTGGLRWLPEPQVRRVVMAPSYFARPFNYVFQGADWRLFAYPIADAALGAVDAGIAPQSVVRLYRALGDSTRMRILKLLSDRDFYLTELALQLELSKPTMKHHLALLRAAGLVTVTEEGSLTYYSLRRERLEEAGTELHSFLA